MLSINNPLSSACKNGVLLAAHRGTFGGNIMQNTIAACENALKHKADILEIDVAKTRDGDFFVFHTGQESNLLGANQRLDSMSTEQVRSYNLLNSLQETTSQKVDTLDDLLEHFKGRCLINLDRCWFYWEDIIRYIGRKNMHDQIILKSPAEKSFLELLEDSRSKVMYMPIIRERSHWVYSLSYKINLIAAEIVFLSDDNEIAQRQFIEEMQSRGILVWINAVTLDDRTVLNGSHDDNNAILQDMHDNWGWLIKQGANIILTDWPMLLRSYIEENTIKPRNSFKTEKNNVSNADFRL